MVMFCYTNTMSKSENRKPLFNTAHPEHKKYTRRAEVVGATALMAVIGFAYGVDQAENAHNPSSITSEISNNPVIEGEIKITNANGFETKLRNSPNLPVVNGDPGLISDSNVVLTLQNDQMFQSDVAVVYTAPNNDTWYGFPYGGDTNGVWVDVTQTGNNVTVNGEPALTYNSQDSSSIVTKNNTLYLENSDKTIQPVPEARLIDNPKP